MAIIVRATRSRSKDVLVDPIRPQGLIMTRIAEFIPEPKAFNWPVDPYTSLPINQPSNIYSIQQRRSPRRSFGKNTPFYQGSYVRVKW